MSTFRVVLLVAISTLLLGESIVAQNHALSLELIPDKSSLVLGEPLLLTAGAKNIGASIVSMYNQNSPSISRRGITPFLICLSKDGEKWEGWLDQFRHSTKTAPSRLAAGQELISSFVVLFQRGHGFAFAQPGTYWASVKIICTDMSEIQSQPIQITVSEPTGSSLEAWHIVSKEDFQEKYGEVTQAPWLATLGADDLNLCDEIIKDYPNAAQGPYLVLCLGRTYLEGPTKDRVKSVHYLDIAKSRASSEAFKARVLDAIAQIPSENPLDRLLPGRPGAEPPAQPLEPKVQKQVEAVFHGYLAAGRAGNLERMLSFTANDYRGMSRDQQRKRFQDEIDEVKDLQRRGIPSDLTANVVSVVRSADDVLLTATVVYREGSTRHSEKTVRCRLSKYGDQWLLQDWETLKYERK